MSTPREEMRIRIWCSPRPDMGGYPWNWAVDHYGETIEFGREKTEADARGEAEQAAQSWSDLMAS